MRLFLLLLPMAACTHQNRAPLMLGTHQDTVSVAYVSGGIATPNWRNLSERPYGRLIVGDTVIAMESDGGTLLFVLPLRDVKDVQATAEQRAAAPLSPAGRSEYLRVETTTPDVLVFRTRRAFTADAAAVKIRARLHR